MGHFPLGLAMICANCDAVFAVRSRCPACTSETIYPVEKFFRRPGATFTSEAEAALYRLHVLSKSA